MLMVILGNFLFQGNELGNAFEFVVGPSDGD